ncbi:hypothetical protein WJX77_009079 [Trebouxia sp. C0004]
MCVPPPPPVPARPPSFPPPRPAPRQSPTISVAQTWLEKAEDRPEASKSSGQGQLTEPGKDFKSSPDGKFTAPMWREVDAREALNKARRFGRKLK